jgi:hypothetical protein
MKYLKRFNESNISPDYNVVAPIRSEIEDILIEFKYGYDIKFVHYSTIHSKDNFQLQILPKGYPNSSDTILIDRDILDDLRTVCSFIESEIDFKYSHSYYYAENRVNGGEKPVLADQRMIYEKDIFSSGGRLVSIIQMFFTGPNDLNESVNYDSLVRVYGKDNLEECDSIMLDIKDLSYDLLDLGFEVKIDYSYSTKNLRERTPKIEVNIIGEDSLFDENYSDVVLPVIGSIKKYVSGFGFSTGGHLSDNSFAGFTKFMTYKLLIQK